MTIVMTEKNQITIPKRVTEVLGLKRGSMFNVEVHRHRIELIPLEVTEKQFTNEQYNKLNALSKSEKGTEKKVTSNMIHRLKKGHV